MATDSILRLSGVPVGMMQLDVVLPAQHFGPRRRQAPEQRLMIAVFHDALDCVLKYRRAANSRDQQLFSEARRWFLADDESSWPYSFEGICAILDLDARAVRQQLRLEP